MENFNYIEVGKNKRSWSIQGCKELINAIAKHNYSLCWGSHNWKILKEDYSNVEEEKPYSVYFSNFKVQGFLFKGDVYIFLNAKDLFDFYLVNSKNKLFLKVQDVYVSQLIQILDSKIETK